MQKPKNIFGGGIKSKAKSSEFLPWNKFNLRDLRKIYNTENGFKPPGQVETI